MTDVLEQPTTAQELSSSISINSVEKALKFLDIDWIVDVPSKSKIPVMLAIFEDRIRSGIKNHNVKFLKPLTEAKNVLLRSEVENMIKTAGRFNMNGMIPFETSCIKCRGTGEIYKFFRAGETVPCKFCTNGKPEDYGYNFITCPQCNGSKQISTIENEGTEDERVVNVVCPDCYRNPKTGMPTGKKRVICRTCLGKGKFRRIIIDAKIKSTTHCHHCKGRGFTLPEPPKKQPVAKVVFRKKAPSMKNPVISAKMGEQLKHLADELRITTIKE